MVRKLIAERPQASQISLSIIDLQCSIQHIQADSLQWATSHPGQHVLNHSIHFIGIPKTIQLWEVQSNVIHTFVTMNGEVQKYHGKFCLVPICF